METISESKFANNSFTGDLNRNLLLQGMLGSIQGNRIDSNDFSENKVNQSRFILFWNTVLGISPQSAQECIFLNSDPNIKLYSLKNHHWVNI